MATYTHLGSTEVADICVSYGLGVLDTAPIAGGAANSSFLVRCTEGNFVLTVLDDHDASSAAHLAELMRYLDDSGIGPPAPLLTSEGVALAWLQDLPVMVRPYVPGICKKVLSHSLVFALGGILARVNSLDPRTAGLTLGSGGRRLPLDTRSHIDSFTDRAFADWLIEVLDGTFDLFETPLAVGLVHGDVFSDNVVVTMNGTPVIIDWETACIDARILDIGMAVVGLCRVEGHFDEMRAREFVRGYEDQGAIEEAERSQLMNAIIYAAAFVGYHRYLRHNVSRPDPVRASMYKEMPVFVDEVLSSSLW